MRFTPVLFAGCLLLAGCVEPVRKADTGAFSNGLAALKRELAEVDGKLDRLTLMRRLEALPSDRERREERLDKIKPLPENPSDREIKTYVEAILKIARELNSFSSGDRQVEMLLAIGPGHLELLAPYLSWRNSFHLQYALSDLVQRSDKELVLKLLPKAEGALVRAVVNFGWAAEARPEIIGMLKAGAGVRMEELERVIPLIARTPEERKELVEIYIVYPKTYRMFEAIRNFPGIDPAAVAKQAWEKHRYEGDYEQLQYAMAAVESGCLEAMVSMLEQLVRIPNLGFYPMGERQKRLSDLLGMAYNPAGMLKYVRENKDRLMFDPESRRYILKKNNGKGEEQ